MALWQDGGDSKPPSFLIFGAQFFFDGCWDSRSVWSSDREQSGPAACAPPSAFPLPVFLLFFGSSHRNKERKLLDRSRTDQSLPSSRSASVRFSRRRSRSGRSIVHHPPPEDLASALPRVVNEQDTPIPVFPFRPRAFLADLGPYKLSSSLNPLLVCAPV